MQIQTQIQIKIGNKLELAKTLQMYYDILVTFDTFYPNLTKIKELRGWPLGPVRAQP